MKGLGAVHNAPQHRSYVPVLFSFGKGGTVGCATWNGTDTPLLPPRFEERQPSAF